MSFDRRASSRAGVVFSGVRPPLGLSFASSSYLGAARAGYSVSRIAAPALVISEHVDEERLCWTCCETVAPRTSKLENLSLLCCLNPELWKETSSSASRVLRCLGTGTRDRLRNGDGLTHDGAGSLSKYRKRTTTSTCPRVVMHTTCHSLCLILDISPPSRVVRSRSFVPVFCALEL